MSKFCLIGNAPSSGSTLLADILDSTPYSACGPELEFFCNKFLYNFDDFKKKPTKTSFISTLKSTGIYPNYERLEHYGLSQSGLFKMVAQSDNLPSFLSQFSNHFLSFRNKNTDGIVFEKTPQNINTIHEFLTNYPSGYFVFIVRNPLYVYNSLLNRGWGNYLALCTWLITAAHISKYVTHKRVKIIKYEDLIASPFETASQLIYEISNKKVSILQLQEGYQTNEYRKKSSKGINTWQASASRNEIIDANQKKIESKIIENFSGIRNLKVSSAYAHRYNIDELSFEKAISFFGYEDLLKILPTTISPKIPKKSHKDIRKLTMKWTKEVFKGDFNILSFNEIKNAVELV